MTASCSSRPDSASQVGGRPGCGPVRIGSVNMAVRSAIIASITWRVRAAIRSAVTRTLASSVGCSSSSAAMSSRQPGGRADHSATAANSARLSSKARKTVPSAMPAASAICRVVGRGGVLQQRGDRLDDGLAAVLGGHGSGAGSHAGQCK